jgi:hypothetical protein
MEAKDHDYGLQGLEDFFAYEESLDYFNIEIPSLDVLVINASKKGLDTFLKLYSDIIPERIILKGWSLPNRRWTTFSRTDFFRLTKHYLRDGLSKTIEHLDICFIDDYEETTIFSAEFRDGPVLFVNRRGWQKFLDALRHLRDENYWFYIPTPSHNPGMNLRFELSDPYEGEQKDHVFKCIECIRLEPYEEISLKVKGKLRPNGLYAFIRGNCTGLLLLRYWLDSFANSGEKYQEFINEWPVFSCGIPDNEVYKSNKICLHKIDSEDIPLISFQCQEGSSDFHMFGNKKGFQEIYEWIEWYAFDSDHDDWYLELRSGKKEVYKGSLSAEVEPAKHFIRAEGWEIVGGCFYDQKYNPLHGHYYPIDPDVKQKFIRERLVFV